MRQSLAERKLELIAAIIRITDVKVLEKLEAILNENNLSPKSKAPVKRER